MPQQRGIGMGMGMDTAVRVIHVFLLDKITINGEDLSRDAEVS